MRQKQLIDYEGSDVTCPKCGDTFSGKIGFGKHYALTHGKKYLPLAVCAWCGKMFEATLGRIQAASKHFCRESHRDKWRAKWNTGEENPCYTEPLEKTCRQCGSEFSVKPSDDYRKTCSRECAGKWASENLAVADNPQWVERVELECETCGSSFEVRPSQTGRRKCCSRPCRAEYMSTFTGPDNPHWRGGYGLINGVRRALGEHSWNRYRREARERSGECKMCGATESSGGEALHVHHIVPICAGGTHAKENLMVLCKSCHRTVEPYTRTLTDAVLTA